MLLHVIEAAGPIDGAFHGIVSNGRGQAMRDAFLLIAHIEHRHAGQRAGIARLATGGRVEGRTVQVRGQAVRGAIDHARAEFAQERIGVIKAFGHGESYCVIRRQLHAKARLFRCGPGCENGSLRLMQAPSRRIEELLHL